MPVDEAFDLERFVIAQTPVYEIVEDELRAGRKQTHWMWFVFPQLRALGRSPTAYFFGLPSLIQARAYLAHPELGTRLTTCVELVLAHSGRSLKAMFGTPDDLKFRSSMTLFGVAANTSANVFGEALQRHFDGVGDERTLALLEAAER